jgi:hypothetical protein
MELRQQFAAPPGLLVQLVPAHSPHVEGQHMVLALERIPATLTSQLKFAATRGRIAARNWRTSQDQRIVYGFLTVFALPRVVRRL